MFNWEQVRGILRERPLAGAGVAMLAICLLLMGGYWVWRDQAYSVLLSGLTTSEAAAVVQELETKSVPYRLEDGGATITTPRKTANRLRLELNPDSLSARGLVGFELFNKSDIGLTEFAQQINYRRALQGELARTIMALDGVASARVHLTLAERAVFRDRQMPSKASVTLVPEPGHLLSPATVQGVRRLVAGAAPDLGLEDVVVLDEHGAVVSDLAARRAGEAALDQRQAIEAYYAAQAVLALQNLVAEDEAAVEVSADPLGGTGVAAFSNWSPETRDFAVHVQLELAPVLSPTEEAQALALVSQALRLSAETGDQATLRSGVQTAMRRPQLERWTPPGSLAARPVDLASKASPPSATTPWLVAVGLGGLLSLGLLAVVRRRTSAGRMPSWRRTRHARELTRALNLVEAENVPFG